MSNFSSPYTVPEDRPVPESILRILAGVDRVATEQKCSYVVVGATARDLLLFHVFGIRVSRATLDVDFAIAVESWDKFDRMRNALLATEEFVASKLEHRLYLKDTGIPIDLIPFGGVAEGDAIACHQRRLSSVVTIAKLRTIVATAHFIDTLAERIRTSRWQLQPEKLPYVRAVLVAYFDELLK